MTRSRAAIITRLLPITRSRFTELYFTLKFIVVNLGIYPGRTEEGEKENFLKPGHASQRGNTPLPS
jgi:hypothetical protein